MNSAQISFTVPDIQLKKRVTDKLKQKGLTMKSLFISAMESFDKGSVSISLTSSQPEWSDNMMTEENEKNYIQAKKDLENGVNIISWNDLKSQYL